jgi:protein TonB
VLAAAASLVFHAAVLFLLPVLQEAQRRIPVRTLTAYLEAPKPKPPEPPKSEPLPPPVRPAPVARAVRPVPAPPPVLSVEPAKQSVESAFTAPAPVPAPAAPVAAAPTRPAPQPAAGSGPDPGAVARFRIEFMKIAALDKKYPRIAQDNNWEGRVELHVAIGENGAISSLTVKKSAGRAVFDDEAQAMIRAAKAKIAIPPALRGTAFTMEIAVDFYLKDQ